MNNKSVRIISPVTSSSWRPDFGPTCDPEAVVDAIFDDTNIQGLFDALNLATAFLGQCYYENADGDLVEKIGAPVAAAMLRYEAARNALLAGIRSFGAGCFAEGQGHPLGAPLAVVSTEPASDDLAA